MNIFDIMGPIMVGPSSSHTAGAVRIGLITKTLVGGNVKKADIGLYGSFAATGKGHGTDRAIIAGLLGMQPDDMRIPMSFDVAEKEGLKFKFENVNIPNAHPNTALLYVENEYGNICDVQISSLGGGRILVNKLNGIEVNCSGEKPTIIVRNIDKPGYVAEVTSMLASKNINIATMRLHREKRGGEAVMVIEVDEKINEESIKWLSSIKGVLNVTYIKG